MRECKEFFEGDRVMIVSEPYLDCPFTWVDEMTRMCGKVVTISGKRYNDAYGTYCYEIKEDVNRFCWCSNCFTLLEPEEELPEIEDDSFLVAIHMGGVKLRETIRYTEISSRRSGRSCRKLSSR